MPNERAKITHGFLSLFTGAVDVATRMSHHAGRAGNKQLCMEIRLEKRGAGKRRAAGAIVLRVLIGMDLAGIAQMDSRVGSRKHIELERA